MKSLNGLRDQYQTKQRDYTGRNNKHQTKIIFKSRIFIIIIFPELLWKCARYNNWKNITTYILYIVFNLN